MKTVIGVGVLLVLMATSTRVAAASSLCTDLQLQTVGCATANGDSVDVRAGATTGGSMPAAGTADPVIPRPELPPSNSDRSNPATAPVVPRVADPLLVVRDRFTVTSPVPPPAAGARAVTVADLISFRPVAGTARMQPNGWLVLGLDTNFYVDSAPQLLSGSLLGLPAEVRFTPYRYHWTYGDGTSAVVAVPGDTWVNQGIPQFDPTPTSYVFRQPGEYDISLVVEFTAAYRFGGPNWTPVVGTVAVPANRLHAVATSPKTLLVAGNCAGGGPGC